MMILEKVYEKLPILFGAGSPLLMLRVQLCWDTIVHAAIISVVGGIIGYSIKFIGDKLTKKL